MRCYFKTYLLLALSLHHADSHEKIDYDKLAAFAGMSNPRSASNAWAKIKVKLITPAADGTVPHTPKKTPRAKKAVAPKNEGDEVDGDAIPKATPRKRASKKQDVDGDSSPKKKPARGKAAIKEEEGEYLLRHAMQLLQC